MADWIDKIADLARRLLSEVELLKTISAEDNDAPSADDGLNPSETKADVEPPRKHRTRLRCCICNKRGHTEENGVSQCIYCHAWDYIGEDYKKHLKSRNCGKKSRNVTNKAGSAGSFVVKSDENGNGDLEPRQSHSGIDSGDWPYTRQPTQDSMEHP
ncbi:hypothetical protein BCR34DRAFT_609025 [Clohesyomyces aquaticus]|uniref:Uncharacterized protein n=1 Tax=Clohesyomyces aquaticus TaxID=1231657 RepID=A0A1Y1XZX7_9PLEO|nr:hypothetical protein BCR34DRAFT_609025 [Clohesyomyces aquaticus]